MNYKFIENHKDELIQLTITHRKNDGFGVMFIDVTQEDKADVRFIPIGSEYFPPDLHEKILDRKNNNPDSIAYFVFYDKNNANIIELDLEKV